MYCHLSPNGSDEEPSAGILDSQSVKAAGKAEEKGYDAGKKVVGRKRTGPCRVNDRRHPMLFSRDTGYLHILAMASFADLGASSDRGADARYCSRVYPGSLRERCR